MKKAKKFSYLLSALLAAAVLGGCGSDSSSSVTSVDNPAVHNAHSAIVRNGIVHAWGYNGYGQLGNNTTTNSAIPVEVPSISGIAGVSAGGTHTLAFKNLSGVWAWGNNGSGRLGDNSTTVSLKPVKVIDKNKSPLTGIGAVSAGGNHSLALQESDHSVWAWGANNYGQIGDATKVNKLYAVKINLSSGAKKVAAGGTHSLALLDDGTVWAWGNNAHGQLGNNSTESSSETPVQVVTASGPLGDIVAIAAGGGHNLALDGSGRVWAWGFNYWGQLGTGDTNDRHVAVNLNEVGAPVPTGILGIAAGLGHSLVVFPDNAVWGWGDNFYGQLGNGSLRSINGVTARVQVMLDATTPLAGVTEVVAEGDHSIGSAPGSTWAWGDNTFGQLGNGTKGGNTGFAGLVTGLP